MQEGQSGASGEGGPEGALNELAGLNGIVQTAEQILHGHRRNNGPDAKGSAAVIVQGGRFGSWGLYLKSGVPAHCYNYFGFEHVYARAAPPVPAGKHTIRYEFKYDGGGAGKGGLGTLFVDGQKVGEARLSRTVPFIFSADDFTDIDIDHGAPVTEDYETPHGRFTGDVSWVRIDIGTEAFEDAAEEEEALAGRA